jgi:hypothetical protein
MRHTSDVTASRFLFALCALATLGCAGPRPCGGFESCVSSQAEADQRNAGTGCENYVYCPPSAADAGDASPDGPSVD